MRLTDEELAAWTDRDIDWKRSVRIDVAALVAELRQAKATPLPFRDVLLSIARTAQRSTNTVPRAVGRGG